MSATSELSDRTAFAERLRVQLRARHPHLEVAVDPARFALHVTGDGGVDTRLPLTGLQAAVLREPTRAATLITGWVRDAEARLTPGTGRVAAMHLSLGRVTWCVRTVDYLRDHRRGDELLVRPLAGALVAFVAEELPNSIMRGVPREEWEAQGEDAVAAAADASTARRFATLPDRVRSTTRLARDGWRLAGDALFQGSLLLVQSVLSAFTERAGCDVLLATPDRSLVLAVPVDAGGAAEFQHRVVRSWREAMEPCSRQVLVTDGSSLRAVEPERADRSAGLLRRLRG